MSTGISRIISILIVSLVLTAAMTLFVQAPRAQNQGSGSTQADTQPELKQVESKYVCMVTNQLYDKEQIPVQVEGKMYYGCCQMCEAKLKEDPSSRMAVDPVSGKDVDKSTAVIGAAPDGKVYYFENVEDLRAFGTTSNK
ncbi:MAG: TRASH domain-containing protein [Thermodesulfobacteriota bacterium]